MWDNVIESLEELKKSPGFGCILAHSMGLGKTFQVVSFTHTVLTQTSIHTILVVSPVNTIHNWQAEYSKW